MNFIGWMIVLCEVAFWVVILTGLSLRYLFNLKKLGFFFLALTPLIDLILIAITSFDLYRGATATVAHGLAAVYIGVSLAFGKNMIDWIDVRFQKYILKTDASMPEKLTGIPFANHYAKGFIRHLIAFAIGCSILALMIFYIDDSSRTEALYGIMKVWGFILAIDVYITSSYFFWPKKPKTVMPAENKNAEV
jgi:hypothetical protein